MKVRQVIFKTDLNVTATKLTIKEAEIQKEKVNVKVKSIHSLIVFANGLRNLGLGDTHGLNRETWGHLVKVLLQRCAKIFINLV
jgi:hypothetical protein